ELLDDAAERLDLAADAVVIGSEHCANVLRVESFGARRRPDEVDEDHGDDPALVADAGVVRERCTAREAEARFARALLSAGGAVLRRGRCAQASTRLHDAESSGEDTSVCQTTQ